MSNNLHFILSLEHSRGDRLTWWRPNESGYCYDLSVAGLYSAERAQEIEKASSFRGVRQEIAVPENVARALARPIVEATGDNLNRIGASLTEWHEAQAR